MSDVVEELQLFVTLQVKPEKFSGYLKAMQDEAVGARSEVGNIGFDLFEDAEQSNTLYLLEHWASRAALEQEHAGQHYYIHVRSLEAESLTGNVEERQLQEISEQPLYRHQGSKGIGSAHAQMITLTSSDNNMIERLDLVFSEAATVLREAPGNRALSLFRNQENANERLLLEAWDDADSGETAWKNHASSLLADLLENGQWTQKKMIRLINRGNE